MTRRRAAFSATDITRAARALEKAGRPVTTARILPDGTIELMMGEQNPAQIADPYDEWKAEYDARQTRLAAQVSRKGRRS